MAAYQTRQRRELLAYLGAHPDEPFTVKQLIAALAGTGISDSAVYRNMADLEADGRVKRLLTEGGRETRYQYMDPHICRNNLHLVCTNCGKTVHMGKESTRQLCEALNRQQRFLLDQRETVLYGLCETCGIG